ncbi:MAG: 4-(cytidine 5'-diphospho)-2-C-methyl-D-erythritol kinase [Phycisphaera sp.]|nr:4-(cytidine 5'-diphospho)-2-C-methyl-D-erythritol kinase [Phycisphaera sp.]
MRERLEVRGPAKLNLALSVGGPDAAGMHPISGWMTTIDLYDDLEIVRLPVGHPSRYAVIWHEEARRVSDIDWSISKDLAARAHRALEQAVGKGLSIQARLEKRIPIGGGLGGGSSDAAAMLHGVNRLFDLGLTTDELADISAPLGSDIPFLVHGGAAIVGGLGERIDAVEPPVGLDVVLVLPPTSCPTGPVFGRLDELRPEAATVDDLVRSMAAAPVQADSLFNDLAPATFDLHPELETLRDRISGIAGVPAHLSGSGSTLFVLAGGPLEADLLARAIEEKAGMPAIAATMCPGVAMGEIERPPA